MGNLGNVPKDTLAEVPITVKDTLSALPCGIVTLVTPPLILPLVTLIGKTILNGALVVITALNSPIPTFCRDTISGSGSTTLPPNRRVVNAVNPSNILGGSLESWLLNKLRLASAVIPEKSPVLSDEIPLPRRLRLVIAATCDSVTDTASVTFGTAATIASRTCSVRSATGTKPALTTVSFTSITLIITVIVSESSSSATVIVTK